MAQQAAVSVDKELKRLIQARTNLLISRPFYGVLALRLRMTVDQSAQTFWTDGARLGFNPAYAATLSEDELLGVLAHEVEHCVRGHIWRRGAREAERWNQAADYVINEDVLAAGFALPAGALVNAAYRGQSAEAVYSLLPPPQSQGAGGAGGASGGFGEVRDAGAGGAEQAAAATDWAIATRQAVQIAKARGKMPGHITGLVEELLRPKVDWRATLRRFMQRVAQGDFTWQTPNRRFAAQGVYMPGLRSERVPHVAIWVDTSGSVSQDELAQFGGEIHSVLQDCKPERATVGYCDSAVQAVEEYDGQRAFAMRADGRGGTDFRPPFDWMAQQGGEAPACVIYLTDLEGPFPEQSPEYPVLWVSTTAGVSAPWGETVYLDLAR